MRTVLIESPLQHGTEHEAANLAYLDACIADCFARSEAPYCSHKLYPGVLDDKDPHERLLGMSAGWAIGERLDGWIFYLDRGVSGGMLGGLRHVLALHEDLPAKWRRIVFRALGSSSPGVHSGLPAGVMFTSAAIERFPSLDAAIREVCPEFIR